MENKKVLIEDTLEGFEEELFNKEPEIRLEEELIMEKELDPMILLEGEVKIFATSTLKAVPDESGNVRWQREQEDYL